MRRPHPARHVPPFGPCRGPPIRPEWTQRRPPVPQAPPVSKPARCMPSVFISRYGRSLHASHRAACLGPARPDALVTLSAVWCSPAILLGRLLLCRQVYKIKACCCILTGPLFAHELMAYWPRYHFSCTLGIHGLVHMVHRCRRAPLGHITTTTILWTGITCGTLLGASDEVPGM